MLKIVENFFSFKRVKLSVNSFSCLDYSCFFILPRLIMEIKKMWKLALEDLQVSLSPGAFSTWIRPMNLMGLRDLGSGRQIAEVSCPNPYHQQFIEQRYYGQLQDSLTRVSGIITELQFIVAAAPENNKDAAQSLGPLFSQLKQQTSEVLAARFHRLGLREDYTFDNFAVSSTNEVAHAAAQAVAQNMGNSYNPLFLYGDVGVGKTHLMQAIAIEALTKDPDFKLIYCPGEQFTNEIIEAIQQKNTSAFRQRYRKVQGLFIDDVQFIAGKTTVQEEFFHTFNALLQAGGQVIMTSDRPPSEIKALEDRLRSRFEAGLIVDIGSPTFELRTAIVLIKAQQRRIPLDMPIAQMISANVESARAIEGFLVRLQSEHQLQRKPINEATVQGLLGSSVVVDSDKPPPRRPAEIIKQIADYYNLTAKEVKGKGRSQTLVMPRHLAMYIMRIDYKWGYKEIGGFFSGRDHTTVMHAVEKIGQQLKDSEELRIDLGQVRQSIFSV